MNKRSLSRRALIQMSGKLGAASALAISPFGRKASAAVLQGPATAPQNAPLSPLRAPEKGKVPVAILISEGAAVIDFAGPWEVLLQTMNHQTMESPFQPYIVAETTAPVQVSGGMKIVPNYSLANAPTPKVLVIPAQRGDSPAMLSWIREVTKHTDVTMSVCTGAFLLAKTGLLDGRKVTTHHSAYRALEVQYPKIHVERGLRYVEDGNIASSGGLSCGIDLALHVVARYFGNKTAEQTAYNLEYQGQGWKDPSMNAVYLQEAVSTPDHPICPVCNMGADKSIKSQYKGVTYYFCEEEHKTMFNAAPETYLS